MNVFTTLLKREFWEHKTVFFYLPLGLAIFILVLMFLGLFVFDTLIKEGGDYRVSISSQGSNSDTEYYSDSNNIENGMPIRLLVNSKLRQLSDMRPEGRKVQIKKALFSLAAPISTVLIFVIF